MVDCSGVARLQARTLTETCGNSSHIHFVPRLHSSVGLHCSHFTSGYSPEKHPGNALQQSNIVKQIHDSYDSYDLFAIWPSCCLTLDQYLLSLAETPWYQRWNQAPFFTQNKWFAKPSRVIVCLYVPTSKVAASRPSTVINSCQRHPRHSFNENEASFRLRTTPRVKMERTWIMESDGMKHWAVPAHLRLDKSEFFTMPSDSMTGTCKASLEGIAKIQIQIDTDADLVCTMLTMLTIVTMLTMQRPAPQEALQPG